MQRPTLNKNSAAVVAESPSGKVHSKKIGNLPQISVLNPSKHYPHKEKLFLHKDLL